MNESSRNFFHETSQNTPAGNFHKVVSLHEDPTFEWEEASAICRFLPKGWYELAQIAKDARLEFIREYWLAKLPYFPHVTEALPLFFDRLDDIGVYLLQKKRKGAFEPLMVYSLADDSGFFCGGPPITSQMLQELHKGIGEYILPVDYLGFLQVHDGFSKSIDTGLILSKDMKTTYQDFQKFLEGQGILLSPQNTPINPQSLIPFYESFGLHAFQCFYGDWYPDQEMGNVYFSGQDKTISDYTQTERGAENLAFPSFLDWLVFYLESVS